MALAGWSRSQLFAASLSLAMGAAGVLLCARVAVALVRARAVVHRYHCRVLLALPVYGAAAAVALFVPAAQPWLEAVSTVQEVLSLVAIYFYVAFFLDRGRCVGRCGPVELGCVARCAPRTLVRATLVMVLQALLLRVDLSFVVAVLKFYAAGNAAVVAVSTVSSLSLMAAVWGTGLLWRSSRSLLRQCGPGCEESAVRMFLWLKTMVLVFLVQTAVVQQVLRGSLGLTKEQSAQLDSVLRLFELLPFGLWALWAIRPLQADCGEPGSGCDSAVSRAVDFFVAQWRVSSARCLHQKDLNGAEDDATSASTGIPCSTTPLLGDQGREFSPVP
eukprot:m51a1_g5282 hypothetical protein (331) ;mRNA; r:176600-177843